MLTVFLLLDAFRHDYLSEEITPFLWKCALEGESYAGVEQSLGFCERSEILTGLRGNETGFFTAIGFDPQNSPYSKAKWLRSMQKAEELILFLSCILTKKLSARIQQKLRYLVSRHFQRKGIKMPIYSIPCSWLPLFSLTEDRVDHRNPEAFPTTSILTLLEESDRSYCYDTFTALNLRSPYKSDRDRLNAVVRDSEVSPKDLYLVYISAPDAFGHLYGPESSEFQGVMRQLDKDLECFVRQIELIAPGNRFLFLGDHGMVTVTKKFNVEKELIHLLRLKGLRKGHDVVYFLDSTMVRFWAMSIKARTLLSEALDSSEVFNVNGWWMDASWAKDNHVAWPDRRYGDHLWVANPGTIVFPDFFHRFTPCKGMHGYDPKLPESLGMCIHWGKGIPSSSHYVMPLSEAFDLLKRSLEL